MPDTGAPWYIPYVASTDLVSDWPTDSQSLADAIADGLDAAGPAAIGTNVVQAVKTDTFSTSSTSYTPVTDLQVTITPTSNTSKILLIAQLNVSNTREDATGANTSVRINGGNADDYVGDASGSLTRSAGAMFSITSPGFAASRNTEAIVIVYLDSPATTSAVTYDVEMLVSSSTGVLNRQGIGSADARGMLPASSLTAIEVAA